MQTVDRKYSHRGSGFTTEIAHYLECLCVDRYPLRSADRLNRVGYRCATKV